MPLWGEVRPEQPCGRCAHPEDANPWAPRRRVLARSSWTERSLPGPRARATLGPWRGASFSESTTPATGNAAATLTAGAGERRWAERSNSGSPPGFSAFTIRVSVSPSGSERRTRRGSRTRGRGGGRTIRSLRGRGDRHRAPGPSLTQVSSSSTTISEGDAESGGWIAWRTGRNQALAGDRPAVHRLAHALGRTRQVQAGSSRASTRPSMRPFALMGLAVDAKASIGIEGFTPSR